MSARRREFVWGMAAGAALTALLSAAGTRLSAVAVAADGPTSKVVLENDRVRVKDATFPPGAAAARMHTHALAHVGVILTAGTLVFTEPGKPPQSVAFEAGSVGFREANVTHEVSNPGPGTMRVIEVELK